MRWGDNHGGYGEQYWEYNHSPPHKSYHDDPKDRVYEIPLPQEQQQQQQPQFFDNVYPQQIE